MVQGPWDGAIYQNERSSPNRVFKFFSKIFKKFLKIKKKKKFLILCILKTRRQMKNIKSEYHLEYPPKSQQKQAQIKK